MTGKGRTTVTGRALAAVVRAETARVLEVAPSEVRVQLADRGGRLDLRLSTPVPVPPLSAVRREPGCADGGLLDRAARAESGIRAGFERITGRTLSRLSIDAEKPQLEERRRVR